MLSVVLAVHNEQINLEACLESIRGLADQIVVVDGESTDRTVAIARAFNAEVISTTNKSNFHINKQMAIDAAIYPLVLQLDADEVVDEQLAGYIQRLKNSVGSTADLSQFQPKAWYISRKNWYFGRFLKKGGQYPDRVIRLFINGYAGLPQKNVHEQMSVDGRVEVADGHLLHYSHPTFSDTIRKMNTYTSFEADRLVSVNFSLSAANAFKYIFIKPMLTFFSLVVRHRGIVDGVSGLLFGLMSSLHHPLTYLKVWENYERKKTSHTN